MTTPRHLRIRGPQVLCALAIALGVLAATSDDASPQYSTPMNLKRCSNFWRGNRACSWNDAGTLR